ncbi:MAG: hypothetical protein IID41_00965 [Planctomycetes bacterium]|nr:hypothetical protein [Planctomycetota bacterium]
MGASNYQNSKVVVFQQATVATGATSATTIDTRGERYCSIYVTHQAATAVNSSAKWTALKLSHGTTTHVSNHTDVTGAVGTTEATATSSQFVLPVHNDTTDSSVVLFNVDLGKLERILRIEKQATASHSNTSNVIVFHNKPISPSSDSDRGANKSVVIAGP